MLFYGILYEGCASGGTRTHNQNPAKELLYPLSYGRAQEPTVCAVGVPVMGLEPTRRGTGSSLASEASVYYQFHHTGIMRGSEGLRFPRP